MTDRRTKNYKCLICLTRVFDHKKHYSETKHKNYEHFDGFKVYKVNIK